MPVAFAFFAVTGLVVFLVAVATGFLVVAVFAFGAAAFFTTGFATGLVVFVVFGLEPAGLVF